MRSLRDDRGATAILVALVLVLLMGIAAIAIDLGFGFNERRQSQTAADMAVMAGATEIVLGGTQEQIVNQVLALALANTNATYSDADWQALWQNCTDPDRLGFDVGTGTPVDFQPMPAPSTWGGGDLECISSVSSYLRVRVPDQIVETTFARVMGFQQVITSAAAVARIDAGEALGSIVPFGIPAGVEVGHMCLTTGSQAIPPCAANTHGRFGTIASQFYGDYFGNSQVCTGNSLNANLNNPPTMIQNVARGLDHAVALWPDNMAAQAGVSLDPANPTDHPGNDVGSYPGIGFDRCRLVSGAVVPFRPNDATPPNALQTVSGNAAIGWVFDGLMVGGSNSGAGAFDGRLERSDDPNPKRTLNGSGQLSFELNNRGLWDYLNDINPLMLNGTPFNECDGDLYDDDGDILDPAVRDTKIARMHVCLEKYSDAYSGDPDAPEIFAESIGDSPRLVWTPQFWHDEVPSQVYAPVRSFRLIFISGTWLGCNNNSCDLVFFPDELTTDDMSLSSNLNSMRNGFEQLSAFMIPIDAVPEDARPPIPGEDTAHTASLFR